MIFQQFLFFTLFLFGLWASGCLVLETRDGAKFWIKFFTIVCMLLSAFGMALQYSYIK